MQQITSPQQLEHYYIRYPVTDYFGFDIRPFTTLLTFESGETIVHEDEELSLLYFLAKGRTKLFITNENGHISLVNFMDAPCFIGEMELFQAQDRANGVTAVTSCTCFAIRISDCREQLMNDTVFLRHLCRFLSLKAIDNTYHYTQNHSCSLEVRLAHFILTTEHKGYYRERHTETSEFLGVTYRHLLYVLADFVKRGLLEKTSRGYYITDRTALQKLAASGK